ncbi:MAG: hypothetical protein ACI977_000850 [Candidatus Nanohaloarchaea archaeon]|jgi:hypothetical protein
MSISIEQTDSDFGIEMAMATVEDVDFERVQGVLHGEYQQAQGTLGLDEEYDVTVTERDEDYHVQVRGSDGIELNEYVASENPYEDLPENSDELYNLLREDVL